MYANKQKKIHIIYTCKVLKYRNRDSLAEKYMFYRKQLTSYKFQDRVNPILSK